MSLVDRPATEIRDLVATRQVSAREVLQATRERIAQVNPTLNAIVTLNDRADDEARAVDEALARGEAPGLLCGLPVGIKDVTPVAGLRTTYGSPLFADHVPTEDAPWSRGCARRRGHRRQDQLPGVRRWWQHLQPGVRRDPQSRGIRRRAPADRPAAAPWHWRPG